MTTDSEFLFDSNLGFACELVGGGPRDGTRFPLWIGGGLVHPSKLTNGMTIRFQSKVNMAAMAALKTNARPKAGEFMFRLAEYRFDGEWMTTTEGKKVPLFRFVGEQDVKADSRPDVVDLDDFEKKWSLFKSGILAMPKAKMGLTTQAIVRMGQDYEADVEHVVQTLPPAKQMEARTLLMPLRIKASDPTSHYKEVAACVMRLNMAEVKTKLLAM